MRYVVAVIVGMVLLLLAIIGQIAKWFSISHDPINQKVRYGHYTFASFWRDIKDTWYWKK